MAGYTERVDTLITVLEDCAKSKYKRKIASEAILNSKTGDKARRRKISDNLHKEVATKPIPPGWTHHPWGFHFPGPTMPASTLPPP